MENDTKKAGLPGSREAAPSIRELMPEGYLPTLCQRTNTMNYSNMSQVVKMENTNSKCWPAVLTLARETNPEGFARWAAAHPEKLPAEEQAAHSLAA